MSVYENDIMKVVGRLPCRYLVTALALAASGLPLMEAVMTAEETYEQDTINAFRKAGRKT